VERAAGRAPQPWPGPPFGKGLSFAGAGCGQRLSHLVRSLSSKKDIDRTFRDGARYYSPWAVLHARRRGDEEMASALPRLTVVTGKKFRRAVPRNRARRLLRETVRVLLGRQAAPWDLLLVARVDVLETTAEERLSTLQALLRKAGVLAEPPAQT
jgi:ribonuclease P protein component